MYCRTLIKVVQITECSDLVLLRWHCSTGLLSSNVTQKFRRTEQPLHVTWHRRYRQINSDLWSYIRILSRNIICLAQNLGELNNWSAKCPILKIVLYASVYIKYIWGWRSASLPQDALLSRWQRNHLPGVAIIWDWMIDRTWNLQLLCPSPTHAQTNKDIVLIYYFSIISNKIVHKSDSNVYLTYLIVGYYYFWTHVVWHEFMKSPIWIKSYFCPSWNKAENNHQRISGVFMISIFFVGGKFSLAASAHIKGSGQTLFSNYFLWWFM